jgi:hypothetical protein
MGLKPENPVVGGTVLRRAAIQSPNFVTGSAGWQISQDGSAEFNNVIIRNGQVVSGTALYYSGTGLPAANTLIASISATAGTDSAGNAYFAGFTTYGKTGLTYYALNQFPQADSSGTFGAVTTVYTAASQAGPWTAGTQLNLEASNHAALLADIAHIYGISGAPSLQLHSGSGLLSPAAVLTADSNAGLNLPDGPLIATAGTASAPSLITTDTWHAMSLANSWASTGGFTAAKYRLTADNEVELIGVLDGTSATSVTFFTLPAGPPSYRPATAQGFACGATGNVPAGSAPQVRCSTGGVLTINGAAAFPNATSYFMHGFISLDA